MNTKPSACQVCPFRHGGTGFVPDQSLIQIEPFKTLFAIVTRFPTKDDVLERRFLSSRWGKQIEKEFLLPLGINRNNLLISSVIRCYPEGGRFPVGEDRRRAVEYCRRWDEALKRWNPNIWGVTISPAMLIKAPNQATFLRRALARAKEYAEAGYRPVLLLGDEAKETYMPWLEGGMKKWQNHWELYSLS